MKQKLLIAAAASAMMAAPSFAAAQDGSGWYLKGAAGYGAHTDIDIDGLVMGDVESEGNLALNAGIGYDFGENWRVELDGTTMFTDLGAVAQQPSSFAKLRTDALMLNAIYDFADFGKFAPYVGAGIGIVRGDASVAVHDFLNGPVLVRNPACNSLRNFGGDVNRSAFSCDASETDTGIGWQLLAGLGYDITDNLTWDTNYRYMQSADLDFAGSDINALTGASQPGTVEFDGVGAHQLLTGFRYRFGDSAPKPIPVAADPVPTRDYKCWDGSMVFNAGQCPAEIVEPVMVSCWDGSQAVDFASCPAQPETVTCWDGTLRYNQSECPIQQPVIQSGCNEQYRQEIIYYEFDKGQSAETRNTINRVLDIGQFCNVEAIRVVGHTDTSGSAAYNLGLSKRRASDALEELVRQGVDRARIVSEGKGETEPFVNSGDGVKEQLNRRTEVLLTLGNLDAMMSN